MIILTRTMLSKGRKPNIIKEIEKEAVDMS